MPKKKTKKVGKTKQKSTDLVPYELGYLTDPRKVKAAQILAFSGRGAITMAAKEAKVNRNTIYHWLTQPEFVQEVEEASKELAAHAANVIRKAIIKGDTNIAKWYLERVLPKMFNVEGIKQSLELEKTEREDHAPEVIQFIVNKTADEERNAVTG